MVHRDGLCWRHCRWNFLPAKVLSRNFFRVKLNLSCYYCKYYPTFELGFLGDFEDLENVFEMDEETSESSKDQQSERATGENNTYACTCSEKCCQWKQHVHVYVHVRVRMHVQNLQFDQCRKSHFSAWKMSCYVIKAMDNV